MPTSWDCAYHLRMATETSKTHRDLITDLVATAIQVATDPPVRNANQRGYAFVWWAHIDQLRADLEALGIDWKIEAERKHPR